MTGREHADICQILLGLIIDMPLPGDHSEEQLVLATRAILDFTYLAQSPVHSSETLAAMDAAMHVFHANKQIFVDLGIRSNFNLPKLHFATRHYRELIELFGSADNFTTEYTECLHIDLAKEAYRATNRKDEYAQITLWLERKEKVLQHDAYIKWCEQGKPPLAVINRLHIHTDPHIHMTHGPSAKHVTFQDLGQRYGAVDFQICLARFVILHHFPHIPRPRREQLATSMTFAFGAVAVYHKAQFWDCDFPRYRHASSEYDVVVATPSRRDKHNNVIPGRFDTVLVNDGTGRSVGVDGAYMYIFMLITSLQS